MSKFVHELKANDFHLTTWEAIELFPKDGRVVLIECSDGIKRRGCWSDSEEQIIVDVLPEGVELVGWQDLKT
jgi:hypothetical protein